MGTKHSHAEPVQASSEDCSPGPSSSAPLLAWSERGVVIERALYGVLEASDPAHKLDITEPLRSLARQQAMPDGRVFKFKLKAESKNHISGVHDPCRGVRKLLYILLRVDSQLTELTIDEYEGLQVISSFYPPSDTLKYLKDHTHFDKDELILLFERYIELTHPHCGQLDFARFCEIMPGFHDIPRMSTTATNLQQIFLHSLFGAFDRNGDGIIDFVEFTCGLSVMSHGERAEKIAFSFEICDLDQNGIVERTEVAALFVQLAAMLAAVGWGREDYFGDPEETVARLFLKGRRRPSRAVPLSAKEHHKPPAARVQPETGSSESDFNGVDEEDIYWRDLRKVIRREDVGEILRNTLRKDYGHERKQLWRGMLRAAVDEWRERLRRHWSVSRDQSGEDMRSRLKREISSEIVLPPQGSRDDVIVLYLGALNREEFTERARDEADLVDCFGLFDFFTDLLITPIEQALLSADARPNTVAIVTAADTGVDAITALRERRAPLALSGWLEKDKGASRIKRLLTHIMRRDRRFFTVRSGFLAWWKKPPAGGDSLNGAVTNQLPRRVVSLAGARVRLDRQHKRAFELVTANFQRRFYAPSRQEAARWARALRANIADSSRNRFKSFAPVRMSGLTGSLAFFVNGSEYFSDLYNTLMLAKHTIYITDWYFAPGLYLKRDSPLNPQHRLDKVLLNKAKEGVRVYILIWSAPVGFRLESKFVAEYMNGLHPNIRTLRHPKFLGGSLAVTSTLAWSHHQKSVVIDEAVGYVGGVDLCYNRFDDSHYYVTDPDSRLFPGRDYGNLCVHCELNGRPLEDVLDRRRIPRMPWHDVHVRFDGDPARDLAMNFIQRWNHTAPQVRLLPATVFPTYPRHQRLLRRVHNAVDTGAVSTSSHHATSRLGELEQKIARAFKLPRFREPQPERQYPYPSASQLPPPSVADQPQGPQTLQAYLDDQRVHGGCYGNVFANVRIQLVRSATTWSVGIDETERSLYKAYIYAIRNAQHYIYIENQYFISSIDRPMPRNKIARAIFARLRTAIANHERFRVYIVLPVYPASDLNLASTRYLIKHTYRTISRQGDSLLERLHAEFPHTDLSEYISFFSMRNWGELSLSANTAMSTSTTVGRLVTEQVYVHAKLIITDDRLAIVGSANINDRSLLGDRDTEISAVIEQHESTWVDSTMDGKPYKASPCVLALRLRLWRDFLGISADSAEHAHLRQVIMDPVSDESYLGLWRTLAARNSETYAAVFPTLQPHVTSLSALQDAQQKEQEMMCDCSPEGIARREELKRLLQTNIYGFVIEFPMHFLSEESQMNPKIFEKEFLVPKYVFL